MTPDTTELTATVQQLQRQVRTLRFGLGALVAVIGGAGLTAWAYPQGETITAERFMVLDADGMPRGTYGLLADGASVGMMFTDPAGATRMQVRVNPEGTPTVSLLDGQERVRAELTLGSGGHPVFALAHTDAEGAASPRAALSVAESGSAQLIFIGVNGTARQAMIGTLDDGRPLLMLSDEHGEPVWQPGQSRPDTLPPSQ